MNGNNTVKDGRVSLLERLQANAQLTRVSKKTDPTTAQFAAELEEEFAKRLAALQPKEEQVAA